MARILTPLFLFLAHATHRELIQQIQFLKVENEILRLNLPVRIAITPAERNRLIKYGKPLGGAIKELITIVSPRTFTRWLAESRKARSNSRKGRGRPQTALDVRDLILRLARENHWGYTRLLGELKKLGIPGVGRSTVREILRAHGLDPGPERKRGTWNEFIRRHAQTLWACDFMARRVWTFRGPATYYLLFFIHVESRRVWVSQASAHPGSDWTAQQARNFAMHLQDTGQQVTHLLRDRDAKFTPAFDGVFKGMGAAVCKLPSRSPNLNAYAERWCQTLQVECLDHFVVFGPRHLDHLVSNFVDHYHRHRPHQGKDNLTLQPLAVVPEGRIVCQQRLGGLLKHYYRRAA